MLKIGLTGSMGSGKSTISKELNKYTNIFVSDSDKIATFLLENCEDIRNQINKEFGTLNRIELGKIVFNDKSKLKILENILHPEVIKIHEFNFSTLYENQILIIDSPLLIESGYYKEMDYVIFVDVNRELSIERACKRSKKLSKEDIIKRLNLQYPNCLKKMFADYIVDNNGNKEDLDFEIKKLYNKILNWSNDNENSNLSRKF